MKVTQGVLKYCNIYGITFDDKYSNIKTIVTTDNYNSQFSTVNNASISQTSTSLNNNNSYYNRIESCKLIDCNVENGKFVNSKFIGLSGVTNYINDGYFSGCTFSGFTINGGKFYNCVVYSNNLWENGFWDNTNGTDDFMAKWHDGVWNRGHFNSYYGWSGGTFNNGIFHYPAVWYNGIVNGGTFSGITWYSGLVRTANFINSIFKGGVFNNGTITNCTFSGGTFNYGKMVNCNVEGGRLFGGLISGSTINNNVEVKGSNFNQVTVNNGNFYNAVGYNLNVVDGNFYGGTYNSSLFGGGDIYNGTYSDISGSSSLTIHNGTFLYSKFNLSHIKNGNFTNCYASNIIWNYGIYTEGEMYNSKWYDGYWNDGVFGSGLSGNTLAPNGGGQGTTKWTGSTTMASGWWEYNPFGNDISTTISTTAAYGFTGRRQRIESNDNTGDMFGLICTGLTLQSGISYNISVKYRFSFHDNRYGFGITDSLSTTDVTLSSGKTYISRSNSCLNAYTINVNRTFNEGSHLVFFGALSDVGDFFEIDEVNVRTNDNSNWYGGNFYGGYFNGNWYGGTFHYGYFNGVYYTKAPRFKRWVQSTQAGAGSTTSYTA